MKNETLLSFIVNHEWCHKVFYVSQRLKTVGNHWWHQGSLYILTGTCVLRRVPNTFWSNKIRQFLLHVHLAALSLASVLVDELWEIHVFATCGPVWILWSGLWSWTFSKITMYSKKAKDGVNFCLEAYLFLCYSIWLKWNQSPMWIAPLKGKWTIHFLPSSQQL